MDTGQTVTFCRAGKGGGWRCMSAKAGYVHCGCVRKDRTEMEGEGGGRMSEQVIYIHCGCLRVARENAILERRFFCIVGVHWGMRRVMSLAWRWDVRGWVFGMQFSKDALFVLWACGGCEGAGGGQNCDPNLGMCF